MKYGVVKLTAIALFALPATSFAAAPDVSDARIQAAAENLKLAVPSLSNQSSEVLFQQAKRQVQIDELLKQKALELGLDKSEKVQAALENSNASVYAAAYYQHLLETPQPSEKTLRDFYQGMTQRLNVTVLMFNNRAQANEAAAALKRGLSFEKLADSLAKEQVQSLDVTRDELPSEWLHALHNITRGKFTSEPIADNGHYQLVKIAGISTISGAPPFEDAKVHLPDLYRQHQAEDVIRQLLEENGL